MLLSLRIENFALVDQLTLDLHTGLTVLTGETGAGKSIILDALDAALGGKVTGRVVRSGAEKALIEATFKVEADLAAWLSDQKIAVGDDTLVCSREIVANSTTQRGRSRVNGVVVNKQQMEHLRDRLVELTAQGQTVQLGQPALQREWLDSYGGEALTQQRQQVAIAFTAYQQAQHALEARQRAEQERLQQLDLFDYQLRDLNAANLVEADELELLEQESKRLSHSVELQQQSYTVYQSLYQRDDGGNACADLLGQAQNILQDMTEIDADVQPVLELVLSALAQVEEAGREINTYGARIEADPQRLQEVQARISELKQVCRKYGPTLADAIALRDRLQADLLDLNGGGQSLEELEQQVQHCLATLTQECGLLTQLRTKAAQDLETRLINELKPLAMDKVKFEVQITPCAPTATGADQVVYRFSPNPGEPLQPLTEIASGGEMSRFLLALQASFSQVDPVGTLVFDEIDAGVSGRVTQAIAEKLYQLSRHHQVLCVTHQPIVAAMADQHFGVSKELVTGTGGTAANGAEPAKRKRQRGQAQATEGAGAPAPTPIAAPIALDSVRTVVRVVPLNPEARKHELAQLAGGEMGAIATPAFSSTERAAYAFAESLLDQAASLRQSQVVPGPFTPEVVATVHGQETLTQAKVRRAKATRKRA